MASTLRRLGLGEMDRAAAVLWRAFDERLPWFAGLHTPAGELRADGGSPRTPAEAEVEVDDDRVAATDVSRP